MNWTIGGCAVIALLLIAVLIGVLVAPIAALLAADSGAGGGSGLPPICQTSQTSQTSQASPNGGQPSPRSVRSATPATAAATTTRGITGPGGGATPEPCVDPNASLLVAWALAIGRHLYGCPPSGMDVCYDAGIPPQAIRWWQTTCPGCRQWQNGDLQCVMLISAVYGLAGIPLRWGPHGSNAIDFWANFANVGPSWAEIPSAWAVTPSARGLPAPGDMMVWWDAFAPSEGHIAIVLAVTPPSGGRDGSLTFAEANGPGPFVQTTILPDRTVTTWRGGEVIGFIRHL